MTVSIIIAVKDYCENLKKCIAKCLELDFSDFEILILPDKSLGGKGDRPLSEFLPQDQRIRIIPTGPVNPPRKRDIAIGYAQGEILAFIDDDAYPAGDWLKKAIENFKEDSVAAVGGPAVTAQEDNLLQQGSGSVYSSIATSGAFVYRYKPKKPKEVDDYPTCNFLVRKSIIQELGGFNTKFWPGEDTKLCLDITQKLGKKIIYDPRVLVYHHRRPLFIPHLRQVAKYALHRGYFAKRYPQTSLRFSYFVPSLILIALLVGGTLALFFNFFRMLYFLGLSLYLLLVFIFSISKDLRLLPLVFSGTILTHLVYGFYFIKGLLSKKLPEEEVVSK